MTNHERMNKKMDEKMEKTTKKTTKAAKSAPAAKDEKMSIEEKKAKLQEKLQELLAQFGRHLREPLGHFGGGFGEAEVGLAVADPRRDLRPGVADQVKLHAARIPK